jgi:hypothetical protein
MRAHKILNYESILQVLGETGCPFCGFMKNFQTALLQEPKGEVQSGGGPGSICTICTSLQEEEDLRIREFLSYKEHKLVAQWLRSQAVLCMVHGAKLKHGAPPTVVSAINSIMERCRRQLVEDLTRLHSEYLSDLERWGVLGRAAEFMVSQRGLHT